VLYQLSASLIDREYGDRMPSGECEFAALFLWPFLSPK